MVNLTQEQLTALHEMEDRIALVQSEINRMKDAGLDVAALQKQLDTMSELRKGMLRVYGGTVSRRAIT